jgi:cell division protein FtsB
VLKKILNVIKNKYFLTILGLSIWLTFFDRYDLVAQYESRQRLKQLEADRQYFRDEILKSQIDMHDLQTNAASLEKFAREKYLMKKDDEDIFVIIDKGAGKDTVPAN